MKLFGKVFLSLLAFIAIDKALLYLVGVVFFAQNLDMWLDASLGAGFWMLIKLFFLIIF